MHAAFKVKDETTFLKEAAKIVEATQVKLYIHFFSGKCSAFEKYEKSLDFFGKSEKKSFSFEKKKRNCGSDTDTEIGPWNRFPIPKPGFICTY